MTPYVEHLIPVLGLSWRPCNPCEAGKESLRKGSHRIGGRLRNDLATARGSVEAEEIFYRSQVRSRNSGT